jgi:protease IV
VELQVPPKKAPFLKKWIKYTLGFTALVFLLPLFSRMTDMDFNDHGKLAVVEVRGVITDSEDVVRQLSEYRQDDKILGIILRIDSPGGAVAPSQEIYSEVLKIRASSKPVYASMGNLAASGGYYIASATERIFANPGSVTGSIGVIMAFSNIEGLIDKIGVRPEVIKSGEFKDAGSPTRAMTEKERKYLQHVVDDVHSQFIDAVAESRNLPQSEVTKIADGRIFTGRQALDLKLVDELGGLELVIEQLAIRAGIEGKPKIIQEKEKASLTDFLLGSWSPTRTLQSVTSPAFTPSLQFLWNLN